jgi:urea transport system substrate-binding protein
MTIDRRKFLVYGSASLGTAMLLKACGNTETPTVTTPTSTPAATG